MDDPATLQATIGKLVDSFNREGNTHGHTLQLTAAAGWRADLLHNQQSERDEFRSGLHVCRQLSGGGARHGHIVASDSIARGGYTLSHSAGFQALLPNDGYTNFSAIFYHNIGPVLGPLVQQVKSSGVATAQQMKSIDALTANSAPGLIYAYGEPSRIVVASNTGFMGFDLGTLLTMGHNGPFVPQIFLGGGAMSDRTMKGATPRTQ